MPDEITALAAAARQRNAAMFEKRNADRLEPYLRQIDELKAEIQRLRAEGENCLNALVAEQEENKTLKDEIAALKAKLDAAAASAPSDARTAKPRARRK